MKSLKQLVLTFHGLGDPPSSVDEQEKLYWWGVCSFARLLDSMLTRVGKGEPEIAITFDDGNASDVILALPELLKRKVQASFFICAGRIGQRNYLDESMIKDLRSAGMTVGSHGMYHRNWSILNARQLDEETIDARKKIEDIIQSTVASVAIPFGAYNREVLSRLKREKWDCIYTSDRGLARPEARIKARETVYAHMQPEDVLALARHKPLNARAIRELTKVYKRFL